MTEQRQVFLQTPQVHLVLVTPDDAETMACWFNNNEVTQFLSRGAYPMTIPFEREFLEKVYDNPTRLMFGIFHSADKKLIGVAGLHQIDQHEQTATYGVTIGDPAYWGKGIGTEVLKTMLEFAFTRRNLRNVTLSVLGNNPRGKRCYEKCGFTHVGTYPKHRFKNGQWVDEHLMIVHNPLYV